MKSGTVRAACTRGKLKKYIGSEVKQSGNTWLVTKSVMNKEYGEENKMKVTIEYRKNHEGIVGKEWKEVYGEYGKKFAKEHIEQITEEHKAYLNENGLELEDQDTMNDIEASTDLHEGTYYFDVGDFTYYIKIEN